VTDDQHRIGQLTAARLTVADTLERFAADTRDPHTVAAWLLDQLQSQHGWRPPVTAEPVPNLRPDRVADDSTREAAMAQIRAVFAARRT
jgi:hypothetical protein